MTKVYGISDDDFKRFIERINNFNSKHNVIATQTHINKGMFYAVLYFEELKDPSQVQSSSPVLRKEISKSIPILKTSPFKDKPTEAQIYTIKKAGKEVPKTKLEAIELIGKIKRSEKEEK